MSENAQHDVEIVIGVDGKSGYVPITPLGAPPQGETQQATVRENGYVMGTSLGPPPQGEPLLAQQAQATLVAPPAQAQPDPTAGHQTSPQATNATAQQHIQGTP